MSPRQKLSPLQETEARRVAAAEAKANKKERTFSDEEKAKRKERVEKAKDAEALGRAQGRSRATRPQITQDVSSKPEWAQPARRRPFRDDGRGAVQGSAEEEDQRPSLLGVGFGGRAVCRSSQRPAFEQSSDGYPLGERPRNQRDLPRGTTCQAIPTT